MKKLILLISIILCLLPINKIYAEEEHIIIADGALFNLTIDQKQTLENELIDIKNNQDINIYFIYDLSLQDSVNLTDYAKSFLEDKLLSSENIVLVISKSSYVVAAYGDNSDDILQDNQNIFNKYYETSIDGDDFNGIKSYYNYLVEIVNHYRKINSIPIASDLLVNDYINLFNEDELNVLNNKLNKLTDKYNLSLPIITTDYLIRYDLETYSNEFYDLNNYSKDGIMLLIYVNEEEKDIHILRKGEMIDAISDDDIEDIYSTLKSNLDNGQHNDLVNNYINEIDKLLNKNKVISFLKTHNYLVITVILLIIIFISLFISKIINKKNRIYKTKL